MNAPIVIAGTDTSVGKTIFAAALAGALSCAYWKPVQAGLAPETDSETVQRLAQLPPGRILPEAYRLKLPASPHVAAAREDIEIDIGRLAMPPQPRPLVVEMAGGIMVPLNRNALNLDVLKLWGAPVVLCARTTLGTINHSLLSIAALRDAGCPILGVAFIGERNEDSEATIVERGGVRRLGRLDRMSSVTSTELRKAFQVGFVVNNFTGLISP
jgi:dethiobiotin synthetase